MSLIDEMAEAVALDCVCRSCGYSSSDVDRDVALAAAKAVARRLREAMGRGAQLPTDKNVVKATIMLAGVDAIIADLEGETAP